MRQFATYGDTTGCNLCAQGGTYSHQTRLHRDWVIAELRANGMPAKSVAKVMGLSEDIVYRASNHLQLSRHKQTESHRMPDHGHRQAKLRQNRVTRLMR